MTMLYPNPHYNGIYYKGVHCTELAQSIKLNTTEKTKG